MAGLSLYGNTHTGMRRQENEDAFIAQPLWGSHLLLLAAIDGVGGYAGGAFAARLAKDAIAQYMKEPKGDILTMLKEAVVFANNSIAAERERQPNFADMCCVLTAAVTDTINQSVSYVHVGDSRLYRFSGDKLQKITKDHSLVGMQEDAGEISEQEAMLHPQRNMILREIGSALHRVDDPGFLDFGTVPFLPGDQVLLCSDGLTDMLSGYQLQAVLQQPNEPDKKVEKLISMANEAGGQDNITVVIARHPISTRKQPINKKHKPVKEAVQPSQKIEEVSSKPRAGRNRALLLFSILGLILLGASGWIWFNNANGYPKKQDTTQKMVSVTPDSMKAVPDPAPLPYDTIRISKTLNAGEWQQLRDSLRSPIILLPVDSTKRKMAAISFAGTDSSLPSVLLKDIRIQQFDTGIISRPSISLTLNNVGFDAVKQPVITLRKR